MGLAYSWSSTVFCTTLKFWGNNVFDKANELDADQAFDRIKAQILKLNPSADEKRIIKFIRG